MKHKPQCAEFTCLVLKVSSYTCMYCMCGPSVCCTQLIKTHVTLHSWFPWYPSRFLFICLTRSAHLHCLLHNFTRLPPHQLRQILISFLIDIAVIHEVRRETWAFLQYSLHSTGMTTVAWTLKSQLSWVASHHIGEEFACDNSQRLGPILLFAFVGN